MTAQRRNLLPLILLALVAFAQRPAPSGQFPSAVLAGLQWRDVGPMRAGRTFGVAGHADQPGTSTWVLVGGGVWKTVRTRVHVVSDLRRRVSDRLHRGNRCGSFGCQGGLRRHR